MPAIGEIKIPGRNAYTAGGHDIVTPATTVSK